MNREWVSDKATSYFRTLNANVERGCIFISYMYVCIYVCMYVWIAEVWSVMQNIKRVALYPGYDTDKFNQINT
jgi:hypothetical protein